jgi:DNA-binding NtrC family response regulator
MSFLPRLLCYGHYELLLYTRKKILEREVFVETCTQISELPAILSRGPVEIVMICHSVPDEECHEVLHCVRAYCPEVKVLVLHGTATETCTEDSDKTMGSLEGPTMLLNDVRALMEEVRERERDDASSLRQP